MNLTKNIRIKKYKKGFRAEILDRYNFWGNPIWVYLTCWSGLPKEPIYYETYDECKKYTLYFIKMNL